MSSWRRGTHKTSGFEAKAKVPRAVQDFVSAEKPKHGQLPPVLGLNLIYMLPELALALASSPLWFSSWSFQFCPLCLRSRVYYKLNSPSKAHWPFRPRQEQPFDPVTQNALPRKRQQRRTAAIKFSNLKQVKQTGVFVLPTLVHLSTSVSAEPTECALNRLYSSTFGFISSFYRRDGKLSKVIPYTWRRATYSWGWCVWRLRLRFSSSRGCLHRPLLCQKTAGRWRQKMKQRGTDRRKT